MIYSDFILILPFIPNIKPPLIDRYIDTNLDEVKN